MISQTKHSAPPPILIKFKFKNLLQEIRIEPWLEFFLLNKMK